MTRQELIDDMIKHDANATIRDYLEAIKEIEDITEATEVFENLREQQNNAA